MSPTVDSLNQMTLGEIRTQFCKLTLPEMSALTGIFQGFFVGPAMLRRLWGPLLTLTGLGGWWGKEFSSPGNAVNLVYRQARFERRLPMAAGEQASHLDGKPGLALRYQADAPFPWPHILDELRQMDAGALLGMTMMNVYPLQRMAFPFVLLRRELVDGL